MARVGLSEIGVEAAVRILLTIESAAMKQHHNFCGGTTTRKYPCGIWWELDSYGFCKYHTPFASQCQGIARSTGVRCRIHWDLNARGYCCYHEYQAPWQYIAITPPVKQRFQFTSGFDTDSYRVARRGHDVAYSAYQGVPLYSKTQHVNEPRSEYVARNFGRWGMRRGRANSA